MRWLLLCVPLRLTALIVGLWLILSNIERADWMSAAQSFAFEWRDKLAGAPDPESAQQAFAEVTGRRFDNGQWIIGVCRDSRGLRSGGAIVVKDSTGQTRIFLGQGCPPDTLATVMQSAQSLEQFFRHESWTILQFKEYTFQ